MAEKFSATEKSNDVLVNYSIDIAITGIPASTNATVSIYDDNRDPARWSLGDNAQTLGGLSLTSLSGTDLIFSDANITAKVIQFNAAGDDVSVLIKLYVLSTQPSVGGTVQLPPGASATLSTPRNRTTVTGSSTWQLQLN